MTSLSQYKSLLNDTNNIYTGCPKKNVPVLFSVTTGTNTLRTWKTKTDMESSLSQLFIVYSAFILPLSNR